VVGYSPLASTRSRTSNTGPNSSNPESSIIQALSGVFVVFVLDLRFIGLKNRVLFFWHPGSAPTSASLLATRFPLACSRCSWS
jgi:hypothetical protein